MTDTPLHTPFIRRFRRLAQTLCVGLCLAGPCTAWPQVMILLHGHLGSSIDWRISGFTGVLQDAGWRDGGVIDTVQNTEDIKPLRTAEPADTFYALDLPSEASLTTQAARLDVALQRILPRHPGEALLFTGFSAGGVVARLYMVRHPRLPVRALCTIASPHLGTESAEIALLAAESPLSEYATLFGAEFINHSQALYQDLVRERPGSFLYKLNREHHPEAQYIAMVRVNSEAEPGDLVVPVYSQDMNNVVALHGRVQTLSGPGVHGVLADDARHLLQTLQNKASTRPGD
jgi:triacylglycerol lipase